MRLCHGAFLLGLLLTARHSWSRERHYSCWSDNPQPYLEAIRKSSLAVPPRLPTGQSIRAGIVTHHFLARQLMVRFFDALSIESSPEIIVLIGPNHFHHGLGNISFSSLPWKTPFGILETDRAFIQQIKLSTNLPEDPEAFTGEHSVGVLVPFLKYCFPHCRVVPILIDVNADENRLTDLRVLLSRYLENPRAVVLLSMDFSHGSTAAVADSRDQQARQVISAMDVRKANDLHVDCHKGLQLFLDLLRHLGPVSVQINEHTNSAQLTGNPNQADVTSYFTIYFVSSPAASRSRADL